MATAKKPAAKKPAEKKTEASYKVIEPFYDRNQEGRLYTTGEIYSVDGMDPEWIDALETGKNKANKKLIKKV